MRHLSDDEIILLAEMTDEELIYTKEQIEMMGHLKICRSCYDKFCGAMMLTEVTSESGYAYLSKIYGMDYAKSTTAKVLTKTLAVVDLIKKEIHNTVSTVLEQVAGDNDAFTFSPAIAMATRSLPDLESSLYKIEDISDEKTFIVVDAKRRELLIQINARNYGDSIIKVFLQYESGETIEIPLEYKNAVYKGIVRNLADGNARLVIRTDI